MHAFIVFAGSHLKNLPARHTKIVPVTMPLLGPEYTVLCARLQKLVMEAGLSGMFFFVRLRSAEWDHLLLCRYYTRCHSIYDVGNRNVHKTNGTKRQTFIQIP